MSRFHCRCFWLRLAQQAGHLRQVRSPCGTLEIWSVFHGDPLLKSPIRSCRWLLSFVLIFCHWHRLCPFPGPFVQYSLVLTVPDIGPIPRRGRTVPASYAIVLFGLVLQIPKVRVDLAGTAHDIVPVRSCLQNGQASGLHLRFRMIKF